MGDNPIAVNKYYYFIHFNIFFSSIRAYILEAEWSFRNPYQNLFEILITSTFAPLPTDVTVRGLILFTRNTQRDKHFLP